MIKKKVKSFLNHLWLTNPLRELNFLKLPQLVIGEMWSKIGTFWDFSHCKILIFCEFSQTIFLRFWPWFWICRILSILGVAEAIIYLNKKSALY